jgi:hypothetical protein
VPEIFQEFKRMLQRRWRRRRNSIENLKIQQYRKRIVMSFPPVPLSSASDATSTSDSVTDKLTSGRQTCIVSLIDLLSYTDTRV